MDQGTLTMKGGRRMKRNRYAISAAPEAPSTAPILLVGDLCDCLEQAAQLGYDAIEYHTRETAQLDYEKIGAVMDRTGCRVSMVVTGRMYTQGGYSLTDTDEERARAALAAMLQYVEMARRLRAGLVIGWAKGKAGDCAAAYFQRLTESLRVLDEAAGIARVPLVLECINHYETDVFNTSDALVSYLERTGLRQCGIHLDTFHMMLEEPDADRAIRRAGERLEYMHFADSTRSYPGSGILDFKQILRSLRQIGYDGYYAVECFPGDDRLDTAAKALAYLKLLESFLEATDPR